MEAVNSSLVVKDNNFKKNLRKWYIENLANNRNSFDKIHNIKIKAENTAGGIAVGIFAPYLLPIVPAVQKGYKALKDTTYNAFKNFTHKKLDIKEQDIKDKPTSEILNELNDEKVEELVNAAGDIIMERNGMLKK
jgi:hypothetical protein